MSSETVLPRRTLDYLEHGAPKGRRNDELFAATGQFRDAGYTIDEAHGHLMPRAVADGLSEAEARSTINSAYAHEAREPIRAAVCGDNGEQPAGQTPSFGPIPDPIRNGFKILLETCFRAGDYIAISDTKPNAAGERKPGPGEVLTRERWLERIAQTPLSDIYPEQEGLFVRINPVCPGGKTDADVTVFRHCLVEFDLDTGGNRISKTVQYQALLDSKMPIAAILDSGDRSIHGWVCLDAPNRQEYDRRRDLVWQHFKPWGLDPQNKNPSRYSRCPSVKRNLHNEAGEIVGVSRQALLAVNVGAASFAEWEKSQIERDYTDHELAELEQITRQKYRIKDRPFPAPMGQEAFYGIAGQIVDIISPLSEASRESILGQFIVAFGNVIGRGPHRKQAGIHHLNEFAVLIGPTARGRKGTAWNAIQNLFGAVAQQWLAERIKDGLQSGEAIVHAVRDEITGPVPMHKRKAGQAHDLLFAVLDPGIADKRLLLLEEEFGRLLTVATRTGNTLSSTLRKCWDGNQWLHVEGKISPEKATGAHVSMIGHVTLTELLECLREVENRNGFSNRVLWLATKRTQKIPLPRWINWQKDHPHIVDTLSRIMTDIGSGKREMLWSHEGKAAWQKFYHSIPEANAGIVGSIIARSDAHVLRLSMLYAALDDSCLLTPDHLRAATAFWLYCERSAQWAFAEKTGSKDADRIYWALQHEPRGISKNQIRLDVFNNHIPKTRLDIALSALADAGLAYMELKRTENAKRPIEWWFEKKTY